MCHISIAIATMCSAVSKIQKLRFLQIVQSFSNRITNNHTIMVTTSKSSITMQTLVQQMLFNMVTLIKMRLFTKRTSFNFRF
jgi:hypothetical protein